MARTSLILLLAVAVTALAWPLDDYDGGSSGEEGTSGESTTKAATTKTTTKAATTKTTAKTTTAATKTTTTKSTATTGTTKLVFPKLKSPVKGYKYTTAFGVPIFMTASASDAKFQHVASVLAEWIDNNEDGCADTPAILKQLVPAKNNNLGVSGDPLGPAIVLVTGNTNVKAEKEKFYTYRDKAPMVESEIKPKCSGLLQTDWCSDATLEEVFHVVSGLGYGDAFKKVFFMGTEAQGRLTPSTIKSGLATLLDAARGGIARSPTIPTAGYPSKAWYTYSDATCNIGCQGVEYWWMGIAALTEIHKNRGQVITNEYPYVNKAAFKKGDPKLYAMLTDTSKGYKLPTRAPDGKYHGKKTCSSGTNVI